MTENNIKPKLIHPLEIYLDYLTKINGVFLTQREIDVISCLANGRNTKGIANFLSIAPKTVTAHIYNAAKKFGCDTDGMMTLLSNSDQYPHLKEYYTALLTDNLFKESLKEVTTLVTENKHHLSYILVYWQKKPPFLEALENNLKEVGLTVSLEGRKDIQPLRQLSQEVYRDTCLIYFLPDEMLEDQPTEPIPVKGISSNTKVFIFPKAKKPQVTLKETDLLTCINITNWHSYYFSVLTILRKAMPNLDLDTIFEEFEDKAATIYSTFTYAPSPPGDTNEKKEEHPSQIATYLSQINSIFIIKKLRYALGGLVTIGFVFLWASNWNDARKSHEKWRNQADHQNNTVDQSIRSDILLPHEKLLIIRPKLWNQLEDKLQLGHVAVLVGTGGAGKTTLARQFVHQQKANIVWEINAETKRSLIDSFKSLAYRMAKTEEQKAELNFIQAIQDPEEKERQLFYFIKKNLKEHSNWVLLYDNVDNFSEIKQHFPRDFTVWGVGKVILTTRDSNLGNTSYLDPQQIIPMETLSPLESLTLFSKILYNCDPSDLSPSQQESALKFLQNIPPFPLDVSTAAYYIKNSRITFSDYLEKINQANRNFDNTQKLFLQEISDYTKTRYGILTVSFKKLIDTRPEFKELLFLICLLDSQNIPKAFLEFYKGHSTVSDFVHELNKYSLLTSDYENKSNKELATFSLHRSTQTLGKAFLLDMLDKAEIQDYLESAISSAKSFYSTYSEKNYNYIIPLIPHLEMLLTNLNNISLPQHIMNRSELDLSYILGYSYFRGYRSYVSAKKYFSKVVEIPESKQHFSNLTLAILLKDFGEISISLNDLNQSYSERSIQLCKDIKDAEMIVAENLQTIGDAYRKQDNFEQANSYLMKALHEISHLDSKKRQILESKIHDRLGWLFSVHYIHKPEAKQAKEHLLKSLEILNASQLFSTIPLNQTQDKIPCFVAQNRLRLGVINNRLCNYKDALSQGFQEAKYIMDNSLDNCSHDIFLKSRIAEAMGETLLREGKIDQAEEKLSEAIKVIEVMVGKSVTQTPKSFRAEARIRQGRLAEAYEDCLFVLQISTRERNNFHNLLHLTNHYHAAIIKYKQNDYRKSIEHFTSFFKDVKNFCAGFLDEKVFRDLESQGAFMAAVNERDNFQTVKAFLDKSRNIFSAIYGPAHPFITDYVVKN